MAGLPAEEVKRLAEEQWGASQGHARVESACHNSKDEVFLLCLGRLDLSSITNPLPDFQINPDFLFYLKRVLSCAARLVSAPHVCVLPVVAAPTEAPASSAEFNPRTGRGDRPTREVCGWRM